MGDKKYQYPIILAIELLEEVIQYPCLRDEIYLQIIKQLTNNPSPTSIQKGYDLLLLCLATFPANELENYLEMWIRNHAGKQKDKFLYYLHQTSYGQVRATAFNEQEIHQILNDNTSWKNIKPKNEAENVVTTQQEDVRASITSTRTKSKNKPVPPAKKKHAPKPPSKKPKMDQTIEWYYVDNDGQQNGPIFIKDLFHIAKNNEINKETLVWNENYTDWQTIQQDQNLKIYLEIN